MKLFVPGRICLFGEHSDWAGGYRRINAEGHSQAAVTCPACHHEFTVDLAGQSPGGS